MALRIGRPRFLRDTARGLVVGAALGLVLSLLAAATGFGEWGEVLYDALISLAIFYAVTLVGRLLLHGVHDYATRGTDLATPESRQEYMHYTRYGLWLGAGGPAAGGVLALAYRLLGPGG